MDTRVFCVYNLARRVFLSSKVMVADGASQPLTVLKMLVSSVGTDAKSGLWLAPLNGPPALARVFPYDLVYLDKDHCVLETIEVHPGIDFPPYRREVASAVVLPANTFRSTLTQRGDQLLVCLQQEVDTILSGGDNAAAPVNGDRKAARHVPSRTEPAPLASPGPIATVAPPVMERVSSGRSVPAENGVLLANQHVEDNPSVQAISSAPVPEPAAIVTAPRSEQSDVALPAAVAKTQSVSITEVVIGHPQPWKPQPIAAHQGVVEDLFSNWVESPSAPPAWIDQNGLPTEAPRKSTPSSSPAAELVPKQNEIKDEKTAAPVKDKSTLGNEVAGSLKKPDSQGQQTAASSSSNGRKEPRTLSRPAFFPTAKKAVPPAISQQTNAATFTVAQYSMWQVSTPTTVSPTATVKRPATEGIADQAKAAARTDAPKPPMKSAERPTALPAAPVKLPEAKPQTGPAPAEKRPLVPSAIARRSQIAGPVELKTKSTAPAISSVPRSSPEIQNPKQVPAIPTESGKTPIPVPENGRDGQTKKIVETAREPAPADFGRAVQARLEKLLTNLPSSSVGTSAQKSGVASRKAEVQVAKLQAPAPAEVAQVKPKAPAPAGAATVKPTAATPAEFPPAKARAATTADVLPAKLQAPAPTDAAPVQPKAATPLVPAKPEVSPEKTSSATKSFPPAKPKPIWASTAPTKPAEKPEADPKPHNELSMTVPLPAFLKPKADQRKLKISVQRVETKAKNGASEGFGARFKRWLNPTPASKSDRRRAHRRYVPGMVAHYFTGGAPQPYEVADISMTGFYLLTEDRWMPDTMIQMTLQKPCSKGERKQSITVLSRIVRRGTDGVAVEFVMAESLDHHSRDVMPSHGTDRFSLARFL